MISIKGVRKATNEEWDKIWENCNYATFFHSREWAEIWQAYSRQTIRPVPKIVSFSDGKEALIPLSLKTSFKGLLKEYISSPAGTFGGWIDNNQMSLEHGILLSEFLCRRIGSIVWRFNPYDPVVHKCPLTNVVKDETHVLNLEEGFDGILYLWTKVHKSVVRKARKASREGVKIYKVVNKEDWKEYYMIYKDSLLRWGKKLHHHIIGNYLE